MKGDWFVVGVLVLVFGLVTQSAGVPIVLTMIQTVSSWLRALPGPTESFADVLVAWAWPLAVLAIAWGLRDHIALGAGSLARRMGRDDVELGWLKISGAALSDLDKGSGEAPATPATRSAAGKTPAPASETLPDSTIVEALLEDAGESGARAEALLNWISEQFGPTLNVEEFLTREIFVKDRQRAYKELLEGKRS